MNEVIDALGVRRVAVAGVEADDIIGTLARMAEEEGMDVVIVSSDKDMYQLVSKRVKVRDGLKGNEVAAEQVVETFGVPPDRVADLLALAGDPSDNVPGVPASARRRRRSCIREFGSLEAVPGGRGEAEGRAKEKIENGADAARLSMRLVRSTGTSHRGEIGEFAPARSTPRASRRCSAAWGSASCSRSSTCGERPPPLPPEGDAPRAVSWERAALRGGAPRRAGQGEHRGAGMAYDGEQKWAAFAVEGDGAHVLPADETVAAVRALNGRGATVYLADGKSLYRHPQLAARGEDVPRTCLSTSWWRAISSPPTKGRRPSPSCAPAIFPRRSPRRKGNRERTTRRTARRRCWSWAGRWRGCCGRRSC